MRKTVCVFILLTAAMFCRAVTVVIPEKARPSTVYAAEELAEHLGKALKQKVGIVRENEKVSGQRIYLGNTAFARRQGIDFSKFGMEESLIRSCGEDILIGGGEPRGTLYGAYEFLERFVGVTWLTPFVTTIPELKELKIPPTTDLRIQPSFRYRAVFVTTYTWMNEFGRANIRFRVRMRENIHWQEMARLTPEEKARWGITPVLGRPAPLNTFYHYIKFWPKTGMEDALSLDAAGKRLRPKNIYGPGHVCFSSLKARKMFAKQMKEFIAKDREEFKEFPPLFYNLSINDTPEGMCVCPDCKALTEKYQAASGAMLEFVNYVAREIEKVYPDVRIQTSAYYFTEKPPVGIVPHKNVVVRVTPIDAYLKGKCKTMFPMEHPANKTCADNIRKWSELGPIQIWNYFVNYADDASNSGVVNVETIYKNLKFFKKCGADYVFSECEFPDSSSFHTLRQYVGYQMKRDCTQELDVLLDKYFSGCYGPAAVPMRKLYDLLAEKMRNTAPCVFSNQNRPKYLDRDFFRTAEKLLAEAEKLACGNSLYLAGITRERVPLDLARSAISEHWEPEEHLPARAAVLDRLAKNRTADPYWKHRTRAKINAGKKRRKTVKFGAKYPLPEEFKGKTLFDITWREFTVDITRHCGLKLVDDKEACGGKAMCLEKSPRRKDLHRGNFVSGIRSRYLLKDLLVFNQKTFTDEKYHLYHYGRITLTPLCLLWAHWSWYIQQNLDPYYREDGDNVFDVYVSIKLQGPAYSENSKKENAVFIDRILLVKPDAEKAESAAQKAGALERKYAEIKILGETNKSALSYEPGEEMVFTFKTDFGKVEPGKFFLRYTRRGDDNKTFSGKAPADEPLVVKTSLDRPGFVSVDVFLVDEKGKRVFQEHTRRDKRKVRQAIGFFSGAGVQIEKLKDCGEPADFDAFWARQKKRLAQVPFAGKVEKKLVKEYPDGYVYAVSIPAPGPRPATGYMTMPKNAKEKSLPAAISFIGYGMQKHWPPSSVEKDKILFILNAHGQKLRRNNAYYKEFFKSICSGKYTYAFDPEQNKDPENCFFNGMVMRLLRTLEYLKSLPEWNGKDLTASGRSQGGLQTMWAAALDQDVTVANPAVTWCCDMAGTEKAGRIHGSWRIKYVPGLDYYDPVFMAKRIKKAEVNITLAGLGDYISPPSGVAVSYNNLATPKKTIRWVQGSDHYFIPQNCEVIVWSTVKK